jgi:hypothetical protein
MRKSLMRDQALIFGFDLIVLTSFWEMNFEEKTMCGEEREPFLNS